MTLVGTLARHSSNTCIATSMVLFVFIFSSGSVTGHQRGSVRSYGVVISAMCIMNPGSI